MTKGQAEDNARELTGYVFAVGEKPFCSWEWDHTERTVGFLEGLDTDHFGSIATVLAVQLGGGDALSASVSLRMLYVQAVETLMLLLGASVQAPEAVPAWVSCCTTQGLDEVVGHFREGRSVLTQAGRQRVTFGELSEFVHRAAWPDDAGPNSTAAHFGRFWNRLGEDLLNPLVRAEHNALKHGHRVAPGGFSFAVGMETTPGVAAPPEAMRSLGASEFGTTFFVREQPGETKHHVRMRRTSVNWSPVSAATRLMLISMSLGNVVSSLRYALGADPTTVQFRRPSSLEAFSQAWDDGIGIRSSNMDSVVKIAPADEVSKEDLLTILESRSET